MKHPRLAVLITYYNERGLLSECLESLRQALPLADEILVYDDCSKYPAIDYVPKDLGVKVIRSDANHGPSHGRNALLDATTCDYIHYQDSDDLFHPTWSALVRERLQSWPDLVLHEVTTTRGERVEGEAAIGLDRYRPGDDLVTFCLEHFILTDAGAYRTELVRKMGGYCNKIWNSEDYHFHVKLAHLAKSWEIIHEPLVTHRIRVESRSENHVEAWDCNLQCIEELVGDLPSQYNVALADAAVRIGSELFGLGAMDRARDAFRLSQSLGRSTYSRFPLPYRVLAKLVGPLATERVGKLYRDFLPVDFRRWLRRFVAQNAPTPSGHSITRN